MIRLYVSCDLAEGRMITLSKDHNHYLQKVMRLREGDRLLLFNGRDGEWEGFLCLSSKTSFLTLTRQNRPQRDEGDLWLLFSPLKPKRQEFLIEKTTELGVACLWPLNMDHTHAYFRFDKEKAHIIEAAEQCRRLTVPILKPLSHLKDILADWPKERTLFFGDETLASPPLPQAPQSLHALLIGPEGGFSEEEFSLLRAHPNAQGITLNSNILRAETAAIVGIAALKGNL